MTIGNTKKFGMSSNVSGFLVSLESSEEVLTFITKGSIEMTIKENTWYRIAPSVVSTWISINQKYNKIL